jgi:hypothetical protein
MMKHEQREISTEPREAIDQERRAWISPTVRTLATADAELTSTALTDGGASYS